MKRDIFSSGIDNNSNSLVFFFFDFLYKPESGYFFIILKTEIIKMNFKKREKKREDNIEEKNKNKEKILE